MASGGHLGYSRAPGLRELVPNLLLSARSQSRVGFIKTSPLKFSGTSRFSRAFQ